jgi:hypothetical protein
MNPKYQWTRRKRELVSKYFDASRIEDDGTSSSSTPLEFSYEAHNTSTHDGKVDDAHSEVSQSTDVEDSTTYLSSDTHDDEGVRAPKYE